MNKLLKKTRLHFRNFYFKVEKPLVFSQWLYESDTIEKELDEKDYLTLISFNYNNTDEVCDAQILIRELYNSAHENLLHIDRANEIIELSLNSDIELAKGCRLLADIVADGYDFVDEIFIGYASEFDRLGETDHYDERIKNDLMALSSKLEKEKQIKSKHRTPIS